MNKFLNKFLAVCVTLVFLMGFSNIANAKSNASMNRLDLSIAMADYQFTSKGIGFEAGKKMECGDAGCYVPFTFDQNGTRTFGLDALLRIQVADMFYLAVDGSFAGNSYTDSYKTSNNSGFINLGLGANVGFMYAITSKINFFAELGVGYMISMDMATVFDSTEVVGKYHLVNPGVALGMDFTFASVPELNLEFGYKMMPGWRNNLYGRLEYDFTKSVGAHLLVDGLLGSANLGLTFKL